MDLVELHNSIVEYLITEEKCEEQTIEEHKHFSQREKIAVGLLIADARILLREHDVYTFGVEDNRSKLRSGDKVILHMNGTGRFIHDCVVLENEEKRIRIHCNTQIDEAILYDIYVDECVLLGPLIKATSEIDVEGYGPGAGFIDMLSGNLAPVASLRNGLDVRSEVYIPKSFNIKQREACRKAFKRPSLMCVQGTPGSGKTHLLAVIAQAYSAAGKEVLIVSLTHQAVNNALNKLHELDTSLSLYKIGDALRAVGLSQNIPTVDTYNDYLKIRKQQKKNVKVHILGMTLHAAVVNLGLRNQGYCPTVMLIDEAGQIPLTHAAVIGKFGCGSTIFIGDHEQMPPIFQPPLEGNELSKSIFEHLVTLYPDCRVVLDTTYRMNDEITRVCSKSFYEPKGTILKSSDISKNRKLELPCFSKKGYDKSLLYLEPDIALDTFENGNPHEAIGVSFLVKRLLKEGMKMKDIAIITPYRMQVRLIHETMRKMLGEETELPLIDTVERLQGQDVECIIISFSVSDLDYFKSQKHFLLNSNRLNVMISRAKRKVLIFASKIVREELNKILELDYQIPCYKISELGLSNHDQMIMELTDKMNKMYEHNPDKPLMLFVSGDMVWGNKY